MTDAQSLGTIRTAYKYIAAYQRRVLDAIDALNDELVELNFKYDRWSSFGYSFPTKKSFNPRNWVWDSLPLYSAEYTWTLEGNKGNETGNLYFWLHHIADSSYADAKANKPGVEPDPLKDLAESEDSDSLFRGQWVKINKPFKQDHFKKAWDTCLDMHFGDEISSIFYDEPSGKPMQRTKRGIVVGSHSISIESLTSPDDFESLFVEPIIEALTKLT